MLPTPASRGATPRRSASCRSAARLLLLASLLAAEGDAEAAVDLRVDVQRDGRAYVMSAHAEIRARVATAWQTLTDYEHLPRFIPGIRTARVVDRHGDPASEDLVVEERGDAHFLVFGQPIRIRMDVHQEAPREVSARSVPWPESPGDVAGEVEPESFAASYRLEPTPDGVRITYRARIVPSNAWPKVVERLALRQNATQQFGALMSEIMRRERGEGEGVVQ